MSKNFEITLEENDVYKLQRANFEAIRFDENLSYMLDNPQKKFDAEVLAEYTKKAADAKFDFEQFQYAMEEKYIPQSLYGKHKYKWEVDFRLHKMRVEVLCDCGIALINDLGLLEE